MKIISTATLISLLMMILLISGCDAKKEQADSNANAGVKAQSASAPPSYNPAVAQNISTLRPKTAIDEERYPVPMPQIVENSSRKTRSYPMQAPTIPHQIEGYQLDNDANQCMSCHGRNRAEESGAIMVSVTHYMTRDLQFLAEISPRRYFCTQCHVVQTNAKPLVENRFIDMHSLSQQAGENL